MAERHRTELAERGYTVYRGAVETALCEQVIEEGWTFLRERCGVHPDRPETWERWPLSALGFNEAWCLPAMWAVRQLPEVVDAFAELLDEARLWVSVDRLGWKRPHVHQGRALGQLSRPLRIHTDINPWHIPDALMLQGQVALAPNDREVGPFACLPGVHRQLARWAAAHPDRALPPETTFVPIKDPELLERHYTLVELDVGDLCIWDARLPHGSGAHTSSRWRHVLYLRYVEAAPEHPLYVDHLQMMQDAMQSYLTGRRPRYYSMGGRTDRHRDDIEVAGYRRADLSALGRRLLGLEAWP